MSFIKVLVKIFSTRIQSKYIYNYKLYEGVQKDRVLI